MNTRICNFHRNDISHICIFRDCKLLQRWCCRDCIKQGIHEHGLLDSTYVVQYEKLRIRKLEMISKLHQNQLLTQGFNYCKTIFRLIQEQQYLIEQQMKKMEKDQEIIQILISDLNEQNFLQLDRKRMEEIININLNQFLYEEKQFIEPIKNMFENVSKLQAIINKYQTNLNQVDNPIGLWKKYTIKQIDQTDYIDYNNKSYLSSQLSNNEKYLAYSDENKNLKIYDISNERIFKEFKIYYSIFACQFTSDSSQLYVGCENGYVIGFDALNNFKIIFRQQIHKQWVRQIQIIQNKYLITSSIDSIIKKTDIKRKKLIFKLIGLGSHMLVFDYNLIDDMIIIGNDRYSFNIKLWNCKNKMMIIVKNDANNRPLHCRPIKLIQFINHYQHVLSLDQDGLLCKWRINFIQKDFIKIQQFKDPDIILNFCQINQNQNLVLICRDCIKILNQGGEVILTLSYKDQVQDQRFRQNQNQCKN